MDLSIWLLAVFSCIFVLADSADFPKTWKPCKKNKNLNACIKQSIEGVIPDLVKGIPQLGMNPIDPLHFDTLSIAQSSNPVNVDLTFQDFDIIGLKKLTIDSIDMDWKRMKVNASVPKVIAKGKYKSDGKILFLPIKGGGNCVLELENFTTSAVIYFTEKTIKGKKYYQIEKMSVPIECERMKLRFDDFLGNDKTLGNQINTFLNENWRPIFNEIGPAVSDALTQAFTIMGNRLFSKIPKDQITPP